MTTTLVGSGVYDAQEMSHLLAEHMDCIVRWATPDACGRPAIVAPSLGRSFSFLDLVSVAIVSELYRRQVAEVEIRSGVEYLRQRTGHERPLAHRTVTESLATSGVAWLADLDHGGWYDIGKGGQGTFEEVVKLYLRRLTYDDVGVASIWRPAPLVVLDPRVQAGAPCLEGTRIPTEIVVTMAEAEDAAIVASELNLSVEQIEAAVDFENGLRHGRSIAA